MVALFLLLDVIVSLQLNFLNGNNNFPLFLLFYDFLYFIVQKIVKVFLNIIKLMNDITVIFYFLIIL